MPISNQKTEKNKIQDKPAVKVSLISPHQMSPIRKILDYSAMCQSTLYLFRKQLTVKQ